MQERSPTWEDVRENPKNFVAEVDYDGSVDIYHRLAGPFCYVGPTNLGLADQWRGQAFPITEFNGKIVAVFPFGNLDLSYLFEE